MSFVFGILRRIVNRLLRRVRLELRRIPKPSEYSSLLGKGTVVPCQIESYFLALNKYVGKGDAVLDVGFGLGYGLIILAIKAKEITGVEVDEKALVHCRNTVAGRIPNLSQILLYNGATLPFHDNCFDVVVCNDVAEHVKEYNRFIKEMLRVSRKGVFISTPNRRPEHTNPDGTPKNIWHLREWSYEELDAILVTHGNVEWNFLNGSWDGPFSISNKLQPDSLTLTPFIRKR
ncbi:MAG: class I SAM-dependent methyltransferase [Lentisphaerae bacterium]|nr:class I SAM-dependent methyltransferase [Lentisphaerota bacterium]